MNFHKIYLYRCNNQGGFDYFEHAHRDGRTISKLDVHEAQNKKPEHKPHWRNVPHAYSRSHFYLVGTKT